MQFATYAAPSSKIYLTLRDVAAFECIAALARTRLLLGMRVNRCMDSRMDEGECSVTRDRNSNVAEIGISRRKLLALGGAALAAAASPAFPSSVNIIRNQGHIRRLHMECEKTGEFINIIYWVDGQYIPEALAELNYFMRDARADAFIRMDPKNFDILAAAHQLLETERPYMLLSGYRTKRTNQILRRSSGRVARNSLHIEGKAADVRIRGVGAKTLARAAERCRAGGVGTYRRSGFVHIDCGGVRTWSG